MSKLVFLLLASAFCAVTQTTPEVGWQTYGICNGRAWQTFPHSEKIVYTTAASEALVVAAATEHPVYFTYNLSGEEFVKAVDRFYQEPENLPIPIMHALKLVTLKADGEDPDRIAKLVATERRRAVESKK